MDTSWADRIKDLEELGWSLTAIGDRIGLSPQGVSDIKQGRTKAPTGMAAVELHKLHGRRRSPPQSARAATPSAPHSEAA